MTLNAIVWDDGKGEYDVSGLPRDLEYEIRSPHKWPLTKEEAIERALEMASDYYGSLIEGCEASAHQ